MYNTPLEAELVAVLHKLFPDWEIVNPNSPEHQAGYAAYELTHRDEDGKPTGMGYFFERVLPSCDGGVYMSFRDGMFGKGVFDEIAWQQQYGFPTWELTHLRKLSVLASPIDPMRRLTREQTWERLTNQPFGGLSTEQVVFKPY